MPPTQQNPWASFGGGGGGGAPPWSMPSGGMSWGNNPQGGQGGGGWGQQAMSLPNFNLDGFLNQAPQWGSAQNPWPSTINHPQHGTMSMGPGGMYTTGTTGVQHTLSPQQALASGAFGPGQTFGGQATQAAFADYQADWMTNMFNWQRNNQMAQQLATTGQTLGQQMMGGVDAMRQQGVELARQQAAAAHQQTMGLLDRTRNEFQDTRAENMGALDSWFDRDRARQKEELDRQAFGNSTAFQMTGAEAQDRWGKAQESSRTDQAMAVANVGAQYNNALTQLNNSLAQLGSQSAYQQAGTNISADQFYSQMWNGANSVAAQYEMNGQMASAEMMRQNPFSAPSLFALFSALGGLRGSGHMGGAPLPEMR